MHCIQASWVKNCFSIMQVGVLLNIWMLKKMCHFLQTILERMGLQMTFIKYLPTHLPLSFAPYGGDISEDMCGRVHNYILSWGHLPQIQAKSSYKKWQDCETEQLTRKPWGWATVKQKRTWYILGDGTIARIRLCLKGLKWGDSKVFASKICLVFTNFLGDILSVNCLAMKGSRTRWPVLFSIDVSSMFLDKCFGGLSVFIHQE